MDSPSLDQATSSSSLDECESKKSSKLLEKYLIREALSSDTFKAILETADGIYQADGDVSKKFCENLKVPLIYDYVIILLNNFYFKKIFIFKFLYYFKKKYKLKEINCENFLFQLLKDLTIKDSILIKSEIINSESKIKDFFDCVPNHISSRLLLDIRDYSEGKLVSLFFCLN